MGQLFIDEIVESSFHAFPNTPGTWNDSGKALFILRLVYLTLQINVLSI